MNRGARKQLSRYARIAAKRWRSFIFNAPVYRYYRIGRQCERMGYVTKYGDVMVK